MFPRVFFSSPPLPRVVPSPADAGSAASVPGLIRVLASDCFLRRALESTKKKAVDCLPSQRDYDFLRHEHGDQLPQGAPPEWDEVLHLPGKLTASLSFCICTITQNHSLLLIFPVNSLFYGFYCGAHMRLVQCLQSSVCWVFPAEMILIFLQMCRMQPETSVVK